MNESSDHMSISASAAILLLVFVPSILLFTLIGLSYLFGNWQ